MLRKQKISTGLIGHFFTLPFLTCLHGIISILAMVTTIDLIGLPSPYLPYLSLPYPTLPYPTLPYLTFPYPTLPYPTLPFLTLPFLTPLYLTLPYPSLPYLSLPHPTLPYPTPPYLAFLYLLAWYHAENHTSHFHSRHGYKYLHFPVGSCCFISTFLQNQTIV